MLAVITAWFFLAQADSVSKSLFQVGPFPTEVECESYRKETEKALMVMTVRCFNTDTIIRLVP